MPILILVLLIILIAQFGFWDTMQAVFGAVAMIVIFWLLVLALVAAVGRALFRRFF